MVSTGRQLKKLTLAVSLVFFGVNGTTLAQQNTERTITINMSASELLPADLIVFNININAEAETPQEAFEIHKEREAVLAELLKEFDIAEDDIVYEPIRMNKRQRNNSYRNENDSQITATNQSVSVTFSDFSIYEKIQVSLIENDFDSFNGQFSSSEISEGKEQALINAIEAAKERAKLIAKTSGVKLGPVQTINYSDHQIGLPRPPETMEMRAMSADASMMDFAQTVEVRSNINISYSIK